MASPFNRRTRWGLAPLLGGVVTGAALAGGAPAAAAADEWLSDQPWQTGLVYSVYDPLYGRAVPEVQRDQTLRRTPLTLRGQTYAKGCGAGGFSAVEVEVPAGVAALQALIGIDDLSPPSPGDTYFSVWADGERLWTSPALNRDDAALQVIVPVAGRRRVTLLTDAQAYGNTDLADWCAVCWRRTPVAQAESQWRPAPGAWHVRAEFRPFHLAYRGADLQVTVIAGQAADVILGYRVAGGLRAIEGQGSARGEVGAVVRQGRVPLHLTAPPGSAAVDTLSLPLRGIANDLYRLDLDLDPSMGQHLYAVQRSLHFGVLESRLGRPVSGSIYGVNHHEFVASCEPIAAAGIEWSRLWFCRQWIEPRPGEWQWHWYDERLAAAREVGVKTIGVLGGLGEPAWVSPDHVPAGSATTHGFPADLAAWEEYVRQLATRYRGQVRVWESWNEIMGPAEAGQDGWSVAGYVDLHRRAWRVLKEVDPGNRLLVSADRLSFVERCLDAGLGEAFDGVAIHPYRPAAAPEMGCANPCVGGSGDLLAVFGAARAWLDGRQRRNAGVWATEIGWAVTGSEWPVVSVETHGQYVPRTLILAQGSGAADNLCWHDFALGMFGVCDGNGYPRPALLSYAALSARLLGAQPVRRLALEPPLQGFLFRRDAVDVLALWSEAGTAFAALRPPTALRLTRFDGWGNASDLALEASGAALPVSGLVQYLEGAGLAESTVSCSRPLTVSPSIVDMLAGHSAVLRCTVENVFAANADILISLAAPAGFAPTESVALRLPRGERQSVELSLAARRDTAPGTYAVDLTVTLPVPGGAVALPTVYARVLPPVALEVEPFDTTQLGRQPVPVAIVVRNRDERALSGTLQLGLPAGMTATPVVAVFTDLAPGQTTRLDALLASPRPPRSDEVLRLAGKLADGGALDLVRSLAPVIVDRDGDGVADGWRLNPESSAREPGKGNLAEAAIEPGDREFLCQRLGCSRFLDGWIILHRDNQDRVVQGRRYRVTFRARQQGLRGAVGVAVYNLQPWQSCGIESLFRVGADWETITTEFTASRDSSSLRFEVYFTETGTLWLEGMRLEEVPAER